ncbi:hypothetical protein MPC1_1650004 [Methylocella tundrae]|nr:hypothetical protein MPC1_1650004 [Methylocella tundrae]
MGASSELTPPCRRREDPFGGIAPSSRAAAARHARGSSMNRFDGRPTCEPSGKEENDGHGPALDRRARPRQLREQKKDHDQAEKRISEINLFQWPLP